MAPAADRGFDSSSVNYGGCPSDAEQWLPQACPIVGSFGGADRSPLGHKAGRRLDRLLTGFEVPHDVKIYPGAGHGFMNDHDPEDQTLMLRFLVRIGLRPLRRQAPSRRACAWSVSVAGVAGVAAFGDEGGDTATRHRAGRRTGNTR